VIDAEGERYYGRLVASPAHVGAALQMMANWDCRVSQVVDVNKGLHCFTAKDARDV